MDEVRISLYNILALSWSLTLSGIHLNEKLLILYPKFKCHEVSLSSGAGSGRMTIVWITLSERVYTVFASL